MRQKICINNIWNDFPTKPEKGFQSHLYCFQGETPNQYDFFIFEKLALFRSLRPKRNLTMKSNPFQTTSSLRILMRVQEIRVTVFTGLYFVW